MAALKEVNVGRYAKAIVSAVAAGSAVALTAMQDGSLSGQEQVGIVLAVLGGLGLTYAVPNDPKPGMEK